MLIKKENISQQLIEYFRSMIQTGEWKLDEKIPSENQLSKDLNVSRASIHSVIQQFIALNILESKQGKGTYLRSQHTEYLGNRDAGVASPEGIQNFLSFRMMIEPEVCYSAAMCMTPEVIRQLRDIYAKMRTSVGNTEEFAEHDLRFHRTIASTLNNNYISNVMNNIYSYKTYCMDLNTVSGFQGLYDHELLLEALAKKNGEQARKLMQKQLNDARENIAKIVEA